MEEDRSRGGIRRGGFNEGGFRRGDNDLGPVSAFDARSSATAADVDMGFSAVDCTSDSVELVVTGCSEG